MTPRAFISHASPDKDRIVRALDDGLRSRGIATWLDERDLLPGDKLVDKIFREGISESDVFVVVLSKYSIGRPWVREELDAAVVHRIAGVVKAIIPIVLDGVPPPPALAATVWERIDDPASLSDHLERIANKILGMQPAPIAAAPAWTTIPVSGRLGLERVDEIVLGFIVQRWIETNYQLISTTEIVAFAERQGLGLDDIEASFHALRPFAKMHFESGSRLPIAVIPSSWAAAQYLQVHDGEQYSRDQKNIIGAIVNHHAGMNNMIAELTDIPLARIEIILDGLESRGGVRLAKHSEGIYIVPQPTLRRMLA